MTDAKVKLKCDQCKNAPSIKRGADGKLHPEPECLFCKHRDIPPTDCYDVEDHFVPKEASE